MAFESYSAKAGGQRSWRISMLAIANPASKVMMASGGCVCQ